MQFRIAALVLDEFVKDQRPGSASGTFRVPWSLIMKNWRKPVWPKIRARDKATGLPKKTGEGWVIYRGMINHKQFEKLKSYQK
jgi:hypothetical protein